MEEQIPSPATEDKPRSGSCLIRGLVIVGVLLVGVVLLVLWYNRPIRPVVLTEPEKAVVETKIAAMHAAENGEAASIPESATTEVYQPGEREIIFTDRELNGLLNQHTGMGDKIAFQFKSGALVARLQTPMPEDVPIIGGRTLHARAKFIVDTKATPPMLALEDLTVWGISIPNDWIGGAKNTNLLGEAFGADGSDGIPGVESLVIENGRIVLRLKE